MPVILHAHTGQVRTSCGDVVDIPMIAPAVRRWGHRFPISTPRVTADSIHEPPTLPKPRTRPVARPIEKPTHLVASSGTRAALSESIFRTGLVGSGRP